MWCQMLSMSIQRKRERKASERNGTQENTSENVGCIDYIWREKERANVCVCVCVYVYVCVCVRV
jgi:hypothetical protein